jgi:hypothetical protein
MVTSHKLTLAPAAARHQEPGQRGASATVDSPGTATDTPESVTGTDGSPDAVALVWDLTVHRLHRAFAECLAALPHATHWGHTPPAESMSPAGTGLADVRLAATRHAVDDIQDALRRVAAGVYGTCQRCVQPIAAQRLQAAPTTRRCPTCQADLCG